MMRISLLILTVIFISSCTPKKESIATKKHTLKLFKMDHVNSRAILAIDSETMYYAGANGDIGFTKNDGKKWDTLSIRYQDTIAPNFRSIATNGTALFALSIGNPALLYKITNTIPVLVYKEHHEKVFYDALHFFDSKNGIAMGDPTKNCISIITTNDGGNSWQKIPCKNLPKSLEGEAAFAASNSTIKIINNTVWIATGGKTSRIFKSTDTGKTWNVFNTPMRSESLSSGTYSMDFYDELNGMIVGGDYTQPTENSKNKAISKDGGKSWTLVANGKHPGYKSCVQYVPNSKGKQLVSVGKTGISLSNDGGISWHEINKEGFYTIRFSNSKSAWLAGHKKIGKLTFN